MITKAVGKSSFTRALFRVMDRSRKIMKKVAKIFLVIAILAGIGYAAYRWWKSRQASTTASYQTVTAARGDLTAKIGATGIVHSNQSAVLSWQTSGTVEMVNVKLGDQVTKGQVLATLEQTSLPQTVIAAQADLVNTQKSLDELYKNAEISKISAMKDITTYAKSVRDAQYQLDNFTIPESQKNMTTMQAVETMRARLDAARAAFEPYKYYSESDPTRKDLKEKLDQAQADYDAAIKRLGYEYQLAIAKANLDKATQDYEKWSSGPDPRDIANLQSRIAAAQATINQAQIVAPFEGTITDVEIKPGDRVSPNTVAFRIDDLSRLEVDVQVSEVDINRIRIDQDANLTFDAIPGKSYSGKVAQVAPVGTSAQGVVDFTVTLELTNADGDVKPGMTAAVDVIVNQLTDVLQVPNRAVRVKDGQRFVYVLRNGQLTQIKLSLGASSDLTSQVIDGDLQVGDQIVLNPPPELSQNGPPAFVRNQQR